jgi:titin
MVGGSGPGQGNLISGNGTQGVELAASTFGNTVCGNKIGSDVSGTTGLGNGSEGVLVRGECNVVGGSDPGAGNLISGNMASGIWITGDYNSVEGNLIGTNTLGTAALANTLDGVLIFGNFNTVGGTGAGANGRNIISGNLRNGVAIEGGSNNLLVKNYIGINQEGDAGVKNHYSGVSIRHRTEVDHNFVASDNSIGGVGDENTRNVISGNGDGGGEPKGFGIWVFGEVTGTLIRGNYVGTGADGLADLGNSRDGIYLGPLSSNTTIGGATNDARNVISGNGEGASEMDPGWGYGVQLFQSDNNRIENNFIGMDKTGMKILANTSGWREVNESSGNVWENNTHD